jgi:hypothetical protein
MGILDDLKHYLFYTPKPNEGGKKSNSDLTSGGDPTGWDPSKLKIGTGGDPVGSSWLANPYAPGARPNASPVAASGPESMFRNPATADKTNINEALGILNNPYVTTPDAQGKASQLLSGFGLNASPNFPKQDPYEKLSQDLLSQINSLNIQATPLEQLKQMADSQAATQYDPVIAALQGEMSRTQERAGNNQADARNMYNALGDKMSSEVPEMQQMNQTAQDQSTRRYDDAASKMQQSYQSQAQQQQDVMNQLGIQAATGDPRVQQVGNDQQYFQNQMAMDKQHQLDALSQIGAADQGFQQNMASNSRLAGENAAQDIGKQLEQYLGAAGDKLTGLQSQKASDATNILNQLQQNDSSRVASQSNDAFNRLMAMNNFQLNAMNAGNQQSNSQQELALKLQELQQKASQGNTMGTSSGLSGASNFLAQQYGQDTGKASQLQNMLAQVLSSPEVVQGKVKGKDATGTDTMYDMTNEYVMQQLRNMAQQQGIQGGDINNLIDAYLAYKGSLK